MICLGCSNVNGRYTLYVKYTYVGAILKFFQKLLTHPPIMIHENMTLGRVAPTCKT